ncbi:hypothetical protein AB0O82_32675 [Kitasatospora sp. NPDC088264]|uniref:hypothetical protein n=1 Tax=Kitasatospora sp. NPDC088264 TaxID=3155296 RepID=UPI003434D52F
MTVTVLVCALLVGGVVTAMLVRQDEVRAWQAFIVLATGFMLALTPVGSVIKNTADQLSHSSSASSTKH